MSNRQHQLLRNGIGQRMGNEEVLAIRRSRALELNSVPGSRPELEARYGRVWGPDDLLLEFEVIGFAVPYVVVRRRCDGSLGSLEFQHRPRFYFNFEEDQPA
jgi:hypothetical protein